MDSKEHTQKLHHSNNDWSDIQSSTNYEPITRRYQPSSLSAVWTRITNQTVKLMFAIFGHLIFPSTPVVGTLKHHIALGEQHTFMEYRKLIQKPQRYDETRHRVDNQKYKLDHKNDRINHHKPWQSVVSHITTHLRDTDYRRSPVTCEVLCLGLSPYEGNVLVAGLIQSLEQEYQKINVQGQQRQKKQESPFYYTHVQLPDEFPCLCTTVLERTFNPNNQNSNNHVELNIDPRHWISTSATTKEGFILPFQDKSFDIVICPMILHHLSVSKLHTMLYELKRIIKPNQFLILCELDVNTRDEAALADVQHAFTNISTSPVGGIPTTCSMSYDDFQWSFNARYFSNHQWETIFQSYGYEMVYHSSTHPGTLHQWSLLRLTQQL